MHERSDHINILSRSPVQVLLCVVDHLGPFDVARLANVNRELAGKVAYQAHYWRQYRIDNLVQFQDYLANNVPELIEQLLASSGPNLNRAVLGQHHESLLGHKPLASWVSGFVSVILSQDLDDDTTSRTLELLTELETSDEDRKKIDYATLIPLVHSSITETFETNIQSQPFLTKLYDDFIARIELLHEFQARSATEVDYQLVLSQAAQLLSRSLSRKTLRPVPRMIRLLSEIEARTGAVVDYAQWIPQAGRCLSRRKLDSVGAEILSELQAKSGVSVDFTEWISRQERELSRCIQDRDFTQALLEMEDLERLENTTGAKSDYSGNWTDDVEKGISEMYPQDDTFSGIILLGKLQIKTEGHVCCIPWIHRWQESISLCISDGFIRRAHYVLTMLRQFQMETGFEVDNTQWPPQLKEYQPKLTRKIEGQKIFLQLSMNLREWIQDDMEDHRDLNKHN